MLEQWREKVSWKILVGSVVWLVGDVGPIWAQEKMKILHWCCFQSDKRECSYLLVPGLVCGDSPSFMRLLESGRAVTEACGLSSDPALARNPRGHFCCWTELPDLCASASLATSILSIRNKGQAGVVVVTGKSVRHGGIDDHMLPRTGENLSRFVQPKCLIIIIKSNPPVTIRLNYYNGIFLMFLSLQRKAA